MLRCDARFNNVDAYYKLSAIIEKGCENIFIDFNYFISNVLHVAVGRAGIRISGGRSYNLLAKLDPVAEWPYFNGLLFEKGRTE